MHIRAHTVPLQNQEAQLPIHGIKCFLQVNEDPIEKGLFNVGKLLSSLHFNHCSACSLPVVTAMLAVMQGNHLKPMVHHPFNDFSNQLKEANPAIVLTTFQDEDSDNPPKLDGYPTLIPDGLDKPS
jgi:hypothetical protein